MSLKIALPGKDVTRGIPEDMAVDSDYDSLKMPIDPANPYFGEILVTFQDNPGTGTYPIFQFRHKFNYKPLYFVYFDISKSSSALISNSGYDYGTEFDTDAFADQYFKVTDLGNGFDFNFVVANNSFVDMTTQYFSFRYFVYANDGA